MPQVWFYANSMLEIRLLSEALVDLKAKDGLTVDWRVMVTHSDHTNPDTTFSLGPVLANERCARLEPLQADAMLIAEKIHDQIRERARKLSTVFTD